MPACRWYTRRVSQRRILASTLWQLVSQATMAALSVVAVKCVAVGLSMELAGYYNSAYGYLQLFGILADFGLYAVAIREVSRSKHPEQTLGALLTLRIGILLLSIGSAVTVAWLLPTWTGTPLPLSVSIAAFVPSFTLLAGVLRAVFQVHHKMQYVFVAEVTQRVVTVLLLGGAVLLGVRGSDDPSMLYLFLAMGSLGALTLLVLSLLFAAGIATVRPSFDGAVLRPLLLQAMPYGFAFLATAMYRQTDVTLIALLRTDFAEQNATYGFVQRVMDMAYLFPTFLLNSVLPQLQTPADGRRLLPKTLVGTLLLSGGCALFAALWARPLMQLLTTDAYLAHGAVPGSDSALSLLSLSMFCNGLIVLGFYVLLARHAWKPLVSVLAVAAALSLCLNMLWIPTYGFMGASAASVVTHTFVATALLSYVVGGELRLPWGALLRWAVWMTALGTLLFVLRPLLVSPLWTAGGLLCAGVGALGIAWLLRLPQSLMRSDSLA